MLLRLPIPGRRFYQRAAGGRDEGGLDETARSGEGAAAKAFRGVLAGGLLLTLAANLPGQMSLDSVVALTEARTGVRQTWAPAISSWVLKPFDALLSGAGLYVTAQATVLFLALMSLTGLRPRAGWLAVILAACAVATPQLMIYQGIVWRDVLFANLSVAGFVLLAHAARRWDARPPAALLIGAAVCLGAAALARQNGAILALAAAGAAAWLARPRGWRAAAAWGAGGLAATAAVAVIVGGLAQPAQTPPGLKLNAAMLILEHYDVVGAHAHHPRLRLKEIAKADPAAAALIESRGPVIYTPSRVDTLDLDDNFRRALWHVPAKAMQAQWRRIILHYPAAYLLQRADVFRWTLLTPRLELCLPVHLGVSGPADMLRDLDLQDGVEPRGQALARYAQRFYGTPVFSHLAWAAAALALIVLFARRGDPADGVFVAMLAGSLAFAASFFVVSVACDYRYLYPLDLAAITGLLYAALDPPLRRRG
jgi:hypothetical protein